MNVKNTVLATKAINHLQGKVRFEIELNLGLARNYQHNVQLLFLKQLKYYQA
jgi:hypothetical protein